VDDLYKCFVKQLIQKTAVGGIVILPLNFWSSVRTNDVQLRRDFLNIYSVIRMNIFEEPVFDDTSYTVCSFIFYSKSTIKCPLSITFYPSQERIDNVVLNRANLYTVGGEIHALPVGDTYTFARLTRLNYGKIPHTHLIVKCIDNSLNDQINMTYDEDGSKVYIDTTPKLSSRTYMTPIIQPEISRAQQKQLAHDFNDFIRTNRCKYHSMFLTNYRESNSIARKRISFDLVYKIISVCLCKTKVQFA
jgi:hypothetical protein